MTRNTAQTSIDSYYDLLPKLGKLQQKVFEIIRTHGPIHNRYIAKLSNLEINVVTPRVKELRDLGLVKKGIVIRDPHTKKMVNTWVMAVVEKDAYQVFSSMLGIQSANRDASQRRKAVSPSKSEDPRVLSFNI